MKTIFWFLPQPIILKEGFVVSQDVKIAPFQ